MEEKSLDPPSPNWGCLSAALPAMPCQLGRNAGSKVINTRGLQGRGEKIEQKGSKREEKKTEEMENGKMHAAAAAASARCAGSGSGSDSDSDSGSATAVLLHCYPYYFFSLHSFCLALPCLT